MEKKLILQVWGEYEERSRAFLAEIERLETEGKSASADVLRERVREETMLADVCEKAIYSVCDPTEILLLRYIYCDCYSFDYIAEKLCMSRMTVYRRYKKVLEKLVF